MKRNRFRRILWIFGAALMAVAVAVLGAVQLHTGIDRSSYPVSNCGEDGYGNYIGGTAGEQICDTAGVTNKLDESFADNDWIENL